MLVRGGRRLQHFCCCVHRRIYGAVCCTDSSCLKEDGDNYQKLSNKPSAFSRCVDTFVSGVLAVDNMVCSAYDFVYKKGCICSS
jgi:hypothetical protein